MVGSVNFSITYKYKRGGFKLAAYSDANRDNNPNNGKSTSLYIVMLVNGPISFKVGLQSLTAQSTMEAELTATALTMKEAVFCSKMMELAFEEEFSSVPLYPDNTSPSHVGGNRIYRYSFRAKHTALKYLFVEELVEGGKIDIHLVNIHNELADLGTKHLGRHRHRALIKLINDFEA